MAHWTKFEKDLEQEVKKLIMHLSGIEDEEDQNFQMALKFTWSNFRSGFPSERKEQQCRVLLLYS